jgi:hypothetical protein
VVRESDRIRGVTGPLFRNLHMLDFVGPPALRDWLLLGAALAVLALALGGFWLYFAIRLPLWRLRFRRRA